MDSFFQSERNEFASETQVKSVKRSSSKKGRKKAPSVKVSKETVGSRSGAVTQQGILQDHVHG